MGQPSHDIKEVTSGQITSLVYLDKGIFATSSKSENSGTIQLWEPTRASPLAVITDDDGPINFMEVFLTKSRDEIKLVYASGSDLKFFSIKNLRSHTLVQNKCQITAVTKNQLYENQSNVVSFGLENGTIKDYDLNQKRITRTDTNMHEKKVVALISRDKYLISMSKEGYVVVYDCSRQERFREFETELKSPSSLFLMGNKNTIVVGDSEGLETIDIRE